MDGQDIKVSAIGKDNLYPLTPPDASQIMMHLFIMRKGTVWERH